jgi:hypothetical protein
VHRCGWSVSREFGRIWENGRGRSPIRGRAASCDRRMWQARGRGLGFPAWSLPRAPTDTALSDIGRCANRRASVLVLAVGLGDRDVAPRRAIVNSRRSSGRAGRHP